MKIAISPPGTEFVVGSASITLNDQNCIWDSNDTMHFTPKGWRDYRARKDFLPEHIDQMRQNPTPIRGAA